MAVQARENGAGRHHFTGLVPAMGVAQPGGVALTFLVQDRVQPEDTSRPCQLAHFHGRQARADSLPVSGDEVLQLQQSVLTVLHHLVRVQMFHQAGQDPEQRHALVPPRDHASTFSATHMGSPLRMCLQAVWMTDSQASLRARSMR